jgi:hypothetical protein
VRKIPFILLLLAALLAISFGVRDLITHEFMPYHAVVAGKSWIHLELGVQAIILGMLTIIGGGFISYGCAVLWLMLPFTRGEVWSRWAILTITSVTIVPTLYVTVTLRRFAPQADTPVVPAALVLTLVLIGVALSFLPALQERRAADRLRSWL